MFTISDLLDRIKIIVLWAFSFYGVQSNQMSDRYHSDRKSSESTRHCRSPPRSEYLMQYTRCGSYKNK